MFVNKRLGQRGGYFIIEINKLMLKYKKGLFVKIFCVKLRFCGFIVD